MLYILPFKVFIPKVLIFIRNVKIVIEFAVFSLFSFEFCHQMTILHCQYFIKPLIKCILGREESDSDYMFVAKFGEYRLARMFATLTLDNV